MARDGRAEWNVELAAQLWNAGELTSGQIAKQIGISKSKLCGHAGRHRDLFPEKHGGGKGILSWTPEERSARRKAAKRGWRGDGGQVQQQQRVDRSAHAVPLITLPPLRSMGGAEVVTAPSKPALRSTCCWPLTDGRPWLFCEQASLAGRPYCAAHSAIAYLKAGAISQQVESNP